MPEILKGIVLGTLQGMTEFLPISSSGHLVLARHLLGLPTPGITLEVLAHGGTLLAIVAYFWRDILSLFRNPKLLLWVGVGMLPAGLAGLLLKDFFEQAFAHPGALTFTFALNGLWLLSTRPKRPTGNITLPRALGVGIAQIAALLPGISRSGTTIAAALHLGVEANTAFRFSFLIGFPLMAGALLLETLQGDLQQIPPLLALSTFTTSLLSGLLALVWLRRFTLAGKLWMFGVYTLFLAGGVGLWRLL